MSSLLTLLKSLKEFDSNKSAWVNTIVFITAMYIGVQYFKSEVVEPLQESMYYSYSLDSYKDTQYALQMFIYADMGNDEKVRETALAKYAYYCGSYFGKVYVPKLPSDERLEMTASCEYIEKLHRDLVVRGIRDPHP